MSLICPLCGSMMPARGIQPEPNPGLPVRNWEVVFTCPACGLITTFDIDNFSPRLTQNIQGTQWATQLRQFYAQELEEVVEREKKATGSHFFAVFLVSILTWMILTGSIGIIDLLWGAIVSLIVARLTYRLVVFDVPQWIRSPRRWVAFFSLLYEFVYEMIKQNISLSIRVLRPSLPIRPGIVAVPTRLHNDVALTLLGSLMTLTPDTLTMDIDEKNQLIYVHWIDVQASAPEEVRALVSAKLEEALIRWLE